MTAEVRWSRCNTPGECLPFRISINTGSPGGRYERIERHPVTEYTYPALIATDKSVFHLDKYVFQDGVNKILIQNGIRKATVTTLD
ncbi:unnamed protein product [Allacma fusca]|uniref:Uncharacterized protein n=1 Tax=Allacma fusca TaxID=39272 RepID=A0A8J2NQ79_9HEXA|nr:unnamed protein product [Allacma fusca]